LLRSVDATILLVTNDDAVADQADRRIELIRAAAPRSG
jgi:predicted ABC-type transport system involved in lysophospholipase L1 biosynthesis ATPase subunit